MFLPDRLTAATNRHVHNGPELRAPAFKRVFPGLVTVRGAVLRYSTTTPERAR